MSRPGRFAKGERNMASLGIMELLIIVIVTILFYGLPVVAVVWVIVMLNRLRKGQDEIRKKLEAIEQTLNSD